MRLEVRGLASEVGNAALALQTQWPNNGEGRKIKETSELILRLTGDAQTVGKIDEAFKQLMSSILALDSLKRLRFFNQHIGDRQLKSARHGTELFSDAINRLSVEVPRGIAQYNEQLTSEKNQKNGSPATRLRSITQPQKPGPLEYQVRRDAFAIKHRASVAPDADKANVGSARTVLLDQGRGLLLAFEQSNQDPRVTAMMREAVERLEGQHDTIALGMANIGVQSLIGVLANELPDPVIAQLRTFCVGVGMYLGQFPEWTRYAENAAMADFTSDDVDTVHAAGLELVASLRQAAPVVDDEIPRTLRWMLEAMRNPGKTSMRAVFGVIRSMENLVSIVVSTLGGWLGASNDGIKQGLTTGAKAAASIALLTAVAHLAISIAPATAGIVQTAWLVEAGKIVLAALKEK